MKKYLVLWKTWLESEFDTPWDFVLVERTNEFKSRSNPKAEVLPSSVIDDLYLSFNAEKIDKFLSEHVDAVVLSAIIEAGDQDTAINSVNSSFEDAVIVRCVEIPDEMLLEVQQEMKKGS